MTLKFLAGIHIFEGGTITRNPTLDIHGIWKVTRTKLCTRDFTVA